MPKKEESLCIHCATPVTKGDEFCCIGCESAYSLIHSAGISGDNSTIFSVLAKQDDDGNHMLSISVDGIHCASCIRLIENALYSENDIVFSRVNMSTKRLLIKWNSKVERADAYAQIVRKLGYKVKPFDVADNNTSSEEERKLLLCIAISGFAAGNLMMISVGLWSSTLETMGFATRGFLSWISAIIALPAILYTGRPFFHSAFSVLSQRRTNMDVPISLAIILASLMSLMETISHGEHIYFDSALMLIFFLLIGRYLDIRAKGKARESAKELLSMLSGTATIIDNGKRSAVAIRDLREGMVVIVATGENIPADGLVYKGESEIDMSLITGETFPNSVKENDKVFAGTVNLSAPIEIIVSKVSENSLLSDIVKLMEKAEQGQAHYVRLADKAAKLYTPVVHSMGLLTFLGWWLVVGQDWQPSLLNAITVLIITCPCALGLAVPVVQVLASSKLMKQGLLLKSGDALEKLSNIDIAVFDKTGTLTIGKPEFLGISTKNDRLKDYLKISASLASHSRHPLSEAICREYSGDLFKVEDIKEFPGKGIEAIINGKKTLLGSRSWCGNKESEQSAYLELWLSVEGEEPICFTFSDKLRSDAKDVINYLQESGIRTILLSGDRPVAVEEMANKVGISEYHSSLSPIEKCEYLERLKQKGANILMVGDGLNDAPSLAAANVSISPSTAIDIAQNTADIVFQGSKLSAIIESWEVARYAKKLVKQNFALAVIYNIIAIPIAVLGYATPLVAAIAMSGSSIVVIANSFRLNKLYSP